MAEYHRVTVTGKLTTASLLHIGSGNQQRHTWTAKNGDQNDGYYNTVLLSSEPTPRPYIPASTLRGFLRAGVPESDIRQRLFGLGRQKRGSADEGNSGAVRIYDAFCESTPCVLRRISRTSIDPVTNTALAHHLATLEAVPAGVDFNVEIALDDVAQKDVDILMAALQAINSPAARLGKNKSVGQGRLKWQLEKVRAMSDGDLIEWLRQTRHSTSEPNEAGKKKSRNKHKPPKADIVVSDQTSQAYWKDITCTITDRLDERWLSLSYDLKRISPVLVNDPIELGTSEDELVQHQYMRFRDEYDETFAIIPGSTLKGWARARCRRIFASLAPSAPDDVLDEVAGKLFGDKKNQACVWFDDALAPLAADGSDEFEQTFHAIDRFTGGVKGGSDKGGALYGARAAVPPVFGATLHIDTKRLPDWGTLVLLYLQRDACEGDLKIGWGKGKGYGRLQLAQPIRAVEKYDRALLDTWHQILLTELGCIKQGEVAP